MGMDLSEYMNKVYFFAAIMGVGYAASFVSRKVFKTSLGLPSSIENAAKTSAVLGACALGVDYAQDKKWIPKDPFKMAPKVSGS